MKENQITKTNTMKLELAGLDCASCAAVIEEKAALHPSIKEVQVNFSTQTMHVVLDEQADDASVIADITSIVNQYEPEVEVRNPQTATSHTLLLQGLDCASCAAKIETKIAALPEIISVTLDFATTKLQYETTSMETAHLQRKIENIVHELEPDVVVSVIGHPKQDTTIMAEFMKHGLGELMLSVIVFGIALFAPLTSAIRLALYISAYLISGRSVLIAAIRNIKNKDMFDENFLMSIATLGAFVVKEYPEAVAVMIFFQIGELLQSLAVNRSRRNIAQLMDIRPDYANLENENGERKVNVDEVAIGDVIVVKPGERVPLDGIVLQGESLLDTSALTGESMLRVAAVNDTVFGGCINQTGVLKIQVKSLYSDSTVAKILELVEHASAKKAPTEQFITKFAKIYTPIVVFTAAALAITPPLLLGQDWSEWMYRALIFLVISCPCALVVSIPLSFFGGIGAASKHGILVKGGNYLEALRHVDTVIFDKTGTLTKGQFKVTNIVSLSDYSTQELLEIAAHVEQYSTHPIAKSIVKAYRGEINPARVSEVKETSGHGIGARLDGREVLVGNAKWMKEHEIDVLQSAGTATTIYVAAGLKLLGSISIADELKADAQHLGQKLKSVGIQKTVMLTGDVDQIGQKIGKDLQIDHVHTQLLPHDKVALLEQYMSKAQEKKKVMYVGDGINDAPVLARADVGVAMGGLGSDAAIEAADVVIMSDEPSAIIRAIQISRRTSAIAWQNIALAFVVKGIVLALGAGGHATMWEAVFADVGVTLIAVLNSIRVIRSK